MSENRSAPSSSGAQTIIKKTNFTPEENHGKLPDMIIQEKNTPLMEQYHAIKAQYPESLLLFQVGDFYELFFEDARTASSFLAITLTKRGKNKGEDIPLCGIPVHALSHYLTKLVRGGFRVAICDQLTKPTPGTVVQRGVTNVFTPGTLVDASLLEEKTASYLLSFYPMADRWGLVFSEILTAQLFATTVPKDAHRAVETELIRFIPDEIILPSNQMYDKYFKQLGYCTTMMTETNDGTYYAENQEPSSFTNFTPHITQKLTEQPALHAGIAQLFTYLKKNQARALDQFKTIHFYEPDDYLILDPSTQKNLDLIKNTSTGKHTLFAVMDCAKTAMGSRTIKKWLQRPLIQKAGISQRHDLVEAITSKIDILQQLDQLLGQLADLERIIGRIALGKAMVPDYLALKQSLMIVPDIKMILTTLAQAGQQSSPVLATTLCDKMIDFTLLASLLEASINDDPLSPGIIKKGFDYELDRLRSLLTGGQQAIITLENQEIAATQITSLKIGFTDISGYYIEVTNPNLSKVPDRFQHKQTLSNRQRFVTQELKQLEADLFKAQNEIENVEKEAFEHVKKEVSAYLSPLRQLAQALAYLDGLFGFARLAYHNLYVRPTFNDTRAITITNGRHPVVEQALGSAFIPNDTELHDEQSLLIITGPNMGGKSTYLRQVALTCIMAQCGSFVPAQSANLPILDRIFTRIGAGDNLAEGKSTFLVEMEETATICTQATRNSLVILDEVGRGTSTYDGMALAQAIAEYIAQVIGARCLFATHYHELTHLDQSISSIANYHADCKKNQDTIIFLHKIVRGVAQSSFGLEVAKLARIPHQITTRAAQLLQSLDFQQKPLTSTQTPMPLVAACPNKNHHAVLAQINEIDCDTLSPRKALELLWEIKKQVEKID